MPPFDATLDSFYWSGAAAAPTTPTPTAHARAAELAVEGRGHLSEERLEEAAKCFAAAVGLRPEDPDLRCDLGRCLLYTGRGDQAEQQALAALGVAPDHFASHQLLGQWYSQAGRVADALRHMARALELRADDPDAIVLRA